MATPRLLLFGPPGAGKTSLIDALASAAPTLKAKVLDQSADFQRVSLQGEKGADPFSEVTVLDCSGKSALAMLETDKPFAKSHAIKKPILDADGVVLVIDVSAPKKQMQDDFRQVARWLKHLREYRGQRADIAALPVYVVLTKCDQLAHKDDTPETWKKRIDEAKHQYRHNFEKYFDEQTPGFGSIELDVLATATKAPVFAGKSAKSKELLGVSDLFRDCVASAADYEARRRTAQSRLQNFIAGLVGLIAILGLLVVFLMEFQPEEKPTALDERVQLVLPKPEAPVAQRLRGTPTRLKAKLDLLTDVEAHPEFERLPRATREAVTHYREEIAGYLKRFDDAQTLLKLPYLAKNQQEFDVQEKNVKSFALTEEQKRDWADTPLGHRIQAVSKEYEALHAALDQEEAWIQKQIEETDRQLREGNRIFGNLLTKNKKAVQEAETWLQQVNDVRNPKPLTPREDNVPGVTRILYDDLAKFDQVQKAHKEWVAAKGILTNIQAGITKLIQ